MEYVLVKKNKQFGTLKPEKINLLKKKMIDLEQKGYYMVCSIPTIQWRKKCTFNVSAFLCAMLRA